MFDRFTMRARKVMTLARQEALRLRNDFLGTEHILVGLLKEGGGAGVHVLKYLEVDLHMVLEDIERVTERGKDRDSARQLPFTPRAKKALEYALEEAVALRHNYIGTEHLLLGLMRDPDSPAGHVLKGCGVKIEDVRKEVSELNGTDTPPGPDRAETVRQVEVRTPMFLDEAKSRLRMYKALAERAMVQVEESRWGEVLGPEENSIAIVVKHITGNMRSRWTDFLTTDGEKPDRNRDTEFEAGAADTPEALKARWQEGWALLFRTLDGLGEGDLGRVVTIRGEPHTVLQAIVRQLTHYAYHVGQIVFLARHLAGPKWQSLSIPRGKSKEFEVTREGDIYRPEEPR